MGLADLLVALDVPYASLEAVVAIAEELMSFVQQTAADASVRLAAMRGPFPQFVTSRFAADGAPARRHACVTTIAPTEMISELADCSSGIEPYFALSYRREIIGATAAVDVHAPVNASVRARGQRGHRRVVSGEGFARPAVCRSMRPLHSARSSQRRHEIAPEWHVKNAGCVSAFHRYIS